MPRAFYRALAVTFPDLELVLPLQQKLQTEHNLFALPSKSCGALLRQTAGGGCPHILLHMPQAFYRRTLPHLQCDDKPHFITFCTDHHWILPDFARSLVMESCLHGNGNQFDLKGAVVMPDHSHMIFTPLIDYDRMEIFSLARIMDAIKGASAHQINKALGRKGRVWQAASFDHLLRSSESLDAKIQYLLDNPVREGLVTQWDQYPWLWRKPFENPFSLRT